MKKLYKIMQNLNHKLVIALLTLSPPIPSLAKTVKVSILAEVPEVVKDIDFYNAIPATAKFALESRKMQLKNAGIDVLFDFYQHEMDPPELNAKMKQVYQSDSIASVGFRSSAGVEYTSQVIKGTDFVAIAPFASNSAIFELKPNYYGIIAGNREIAGHLENFIDQELKSARLLTIATWDSPYSRDFYESFSQDFRKKTMLIKTWENLNGIESQMKTIVDYRPDVIVLPNFPVASASLIRMIRNAGINPIFVGADSWGEGENSVMLKVLDNVSFVGYTIRQFSLFNLTDKQKKFKDAMRKKYNADYASVTGLYHDAIVFILDLLIKNKNNLTRGAILKSAKESKYIDGVMGRNCLSSHECPGRTFTILQMTKRGYKIKKVVGK